MLGIVTQKYHNTQIESLKKEFDEKLSAVSHPELVSGSLYLYLLEAEINSA